MAHNGFTNKHFIPYILEEKKIGKNTQKINFKNIFFAGGLEENKGIFVLLKEFQKVVKKIPDVVLLIAGSGSQEKAMKKRVSELGITKNVRFLGWQKNLQKYYEGSALTVVPSLVIEQFGLVTAEAMMYNRAVIGSNRGGTVWLVEDKKTGYIFDPAKEGDFSNKMISLLKNKKRCLQFGQNGKKRIQHLFNEKRELKKIIDLYRHL